MTPRPRPGRPLLGAAALCLAVLLALLPGPRTVRAQEMSDLMARMDGTFADLVKSLLILTAQKTEGGPPFGAAAQQAARLAETAGQIPGSGAFPGDPAFLGLAREAAGAARQAEAAAREKRLEAAVAALVKLHSACTRCHAEFRF